MFSEEIAPRASRSDAPGAAPPPGRNNNTEVDLLACNDEEREATDRLVDVGLRGRAGRNRKVCVIESVLHA